MYLNAALIPANRPTPFSIDGGPNYTICSGQSVTLGGSPTGPVGATYIWSPAAGLDNNTSANPIASPTVTTTYSVVAMNGNCSGGPAYVTVTVNPLPTVTSAPTGNVCSGAPQNYLITSSTSGTTYTWSRGTVSGISNAAVFSQTSNPITEVLNNTTTSAVNVTYVIIPSTSSCEGPTFTYVVTVNPAPTVTSAPTTILCSNTAQNYTITSNMTGTTYT